MKRNQEKINGEVKKKGKEEGGMKMVVVVVVVMSREGETSKSKITPQRCNAAKNKSKKEARRSNEAKMLTLHSALAILLTFSSK